MSRFLLHVVLLLAALVPFASGAVAPIDSETAVHHLTLRFHVDGREVMTPSVSMTSEGPVRLSIGSSSERGYTLVLDVDEVAVDAAGGAPVLHAVLWEGGEGSGLRLVDEVMVLDGSSTASRHVVNSSVAKPTLSGKVETSVELISHAVEIKSIAELGPATQCAPRSPGSSGARPAKDPCCTRKCPNSNDNLSCCGPPGTQCRGCGVSCITG